MNNPEFEKSIAFNVAKILEYIPNSIVIKSIVKKLTGSISAISFDSGEILIGKVSPFDNFIQVIQGEAEIVIDDQSNFVEAGQSIIIPAHTHNSIKANVKCKMLSTIIKSGYEDLI